MAEICVAILDYKLFFCVFTVVWNEDRYFWDIWNIFEIFRKIFLRYLEKKSGISRNIFRRFFVIFVSRPIAIRRKANWFQITHDVGGGGGSCVSLSGGQRE